MNKKIFAIGVFFLSLASFPLAAYGVGSTVTVAASDSVYQKADYVCTGINDQNVINTAINAAPPGGRVILLQGTYYINNVAGQIYGIYLSDTNNNYDVTLEGQGMGTILRVSTGNNVQMAVIYLVGNSAALTGAKIKNLQIDGNRPNVTGTFYMGIGLENTSDIEMDGVYLSNGKGSDGNGYGYWIDNSTDVTIRNCTGQNWDFEPMEIRGSSNILVTGCWLENRIEVYDDSNYITFTNNIFTNMKIWVGAAISPTAYATQVKIDNNYFYNTTDNADKSSGYNIVTLERALRAEVVGNQFYVNDIYGNAIGATYGGYHLVANNYIYLGTASGGEGIYGSFTNSNIIGNYIYADNHNTGIDLAEGSPTYNDIANNYIYASTYGTTGIVLESGADNNIINGNFCNSVGPGYCINVTSNSIRIINNQVTGVVYTGITVTGNNNTLQNNNIVSTQLYTAGIALSGNTNQVTDNMISATNMWGVAISNTGTGNIISRNTGYTTEASGTATVASGTTYVDVPHGLSVTPSAGQINVVPTNSLGNAAKYWISNLGATTFRINVDTDPGVSTATFNWNISVY